MPKEAQATIVCEECGREKPCTEFYKSPRTLPEGVRYPVCKRCLTKDIDNRNPETFMPLLEKFDLPYIENQWIQMTNKIFLKNPGKFGPSSVFGHYLRQMNMTQFKDYHFADSESLNSPKVSEENKEKLKEIAEKKLKAGKITEEEYEDMIQGRDKKEKFLTEEDVDLLALEEEKNKKMLNVVSTPQVDEATIAKELTGEDIQYLAVKWGISYTPSEWVRLEDLYQKYAEEYELNVDREESVRKICRTSLKMDQALDIDDTQSYRNLSSVYDQLRKSARLTEAQNKEEQGREIDSIGQLVSFVEHEGDIIPQQFDPIEYPQDKIDFVINDLQNYVSNLVRDELGLGDLIESFIEKADKQKEETVENIMKGGFNNSANLEEEEEEFDPEAYEDEAFRLMEEFGL
jgi:hypothetical protein